MIGYTSLGTNDLASAANFYDTLFSLLGGKRVFEFEDFVVWGKDDSEPKFSIHLPYDKNTATVGNGVMVALTAESKILVKSVYETAISMGATCEGRPGYRMDGFYSAYFRDLDGNKLNVHVFE
ncbi:VOC family protein [Gilvimarinus sp. SDUM040013]|uniref:VOC family protein n=1 Tax=Gilvimarinus gilvus TaxID=3058038 RepID=A0ABU4RVM6_9GAMM|nr:VOC family protein [Gilvimarinus sp. SDUM040013]MDO3387634.1 VOC family protein [Gilvimarinus sp. SDUM040013]MDX6848925.1 VOC family protein [Gilvimarinus sp. SDUM040013]